MKNKVKSEVLSPKSKGGEDLIAEIRSVQRDRAWLIKSRIMVENRLRAMVAGKLGYHSGMSESERTKSFDKANEIIKNIEDGVDDGSLGMESMVVDNRVYTQKIRDNTKFYEKHMIEMAMQLPIASWVLQKDQRGFGLLSLAILIGEAGDLCNYANPGKLWKRLGCAPYTFGENGDEKTLMGATWRSKREGTLPADAWVDFGYSKRRRSIAYIFGESLLKQNGKDKPEVVERKSGNGGTPNLEDGPYRKRYDEAKAKAIISHPEWGVCSTCKGEKKDKKGVSCSSCRGTGAAKERYNLHGKLLMTKLLLKRVWIEWNRLEGTLGKDPWVTESVASKENEVEKRECVLS